MSPESITESPSLVHLAWLSVFCGRGFTRDHQRCFWEHTRTAFASVHCTRAQNPQVKHAMIYLIYGFIVLVRMVTVMSWLQARMRHVACCETCHVVHDIVLAVAARGRLPSTEDLREARARTTGTARQKPIINAVVFHLNTLLICGENYV